MHREVPIGQIRNKLCIFFVSYLVVRNIIRIFADETYDKGEYMSRKDIVNQISQAIRRVAPTATAILYGSEARGDARPDSDIDLLILLPEEKITPEQEHTIVSKLFEIELQLGVIISTLILPRHQWENPTVITPFYQNVKREGILL